MFDIAIDEVLLRNGWADVPNSFEDKLGARGGASEEGV